jgi:glyoxylase I family protein
MRLSSAACNTSGKFDNLEAASSMPRGFPHHLDLTVTDLARSVAFYDNVLGELGYARTGDYAGDVPCWVLNAGNPCFSIGLHAARSAVAHDRYAAGFHHLALHAQSRGQVDAFHQFLLREHIHVLDAPAEYDYSPGYYAVFFADPDGLKLELVHEPASSMSD